MIQLQIITSTSPDGLILQTSSLYDTGLITPKIYRSLIATNEEHIRQALISLGWTPPTENTDGEDHKN